jgi:hypothetical protein
VSKFCAQSLIDRVQHLRSIRPDTTDFSRVVAAVNLSDLRASQLIVFFEKEYFSRLFERKNELQKWTPLPEHRSLAKERNLHLPQGMTESGYHEELQDDDGVIQNELWFFGELKDE